MALIQPAPLPEPDESEGPGSARRRKFARYGVPVAVAGIAAATISLVPALADAGAPSLPSITAEQLLAKIAASDVQTVDGSVQVTTDLGLPAALSGGGGLFQDVGTVGGRGGGSGSPAAPQSRLPELLVGTHQLHVSADGPDRQKISVIERAAEYSVIHDGTQVWAYDSASNQAYHATLPDRPADSTGRQHAKPQPPEDFPATPQAAAQQLIKAAQGTASFTVDGTARVAGHSAYELVITPQHADTTTVGAVRIAVDAKTGVPLEFRLTPKGGGKPIVDIGFTKVSFDRPAASTFTFTPPKGVKVTEGGDEATPSGHEDARPRPDTRPGGEPTVLGKGWDSIAVITLPSDGSGRAGQDALHGPNGKVDKGDKAGGDGGADSLMNSFGTHVTGAFGSGTVFHTRLVNALLTDKGTLYVGAVTRSALTEAANAGK